MWEVGTFETAHNVEKNAECQINIVKYSSQVSPAWATGVSKYQVSKEHLENRDVMSMAKVSYYW